MEKVAEQERGSKISTGKVMGCRPWESLLFSMGGNAAAGALGQQRERVWWVCLKGATGKTSQELCI